MCFKAESLCTCYKGVILCVITLSWSFFAELKLYH